MPDKPTLQDFFRLRFAPANHVLQSATRAMKTGMSEEIILACLLHDCVLSLIKPDHGWWGAQLFEPYVPEKTAFAIRYHQTLRFYADDDAGYEYPDQYYRIFGHDYQPPQYIADTYKMLKNHKWYMEPRLVTVNDLYAFDPNAKVSIDPFQDIIGRHFKQPKEGLGYDNSSSAHMWRTLARPDNPLTRAEAKADEEFAILPDCWRPRPRSRPPARSNLCPGSKPRSPKSNTRRARRCATARRAPTRSTRSRGRGKPSRS